MVRRFANFAMPRSGKPIDAVIAAPERYPHAWGPAAPDGAGDRLMDIGARSGDRARGKGRCIELVLRIMIERGVHRPDIGFARPGAAKQVQEHRSVSTSMQRPLCA